MAKKKQQAPTLAQCWAEPTLTPKQEELVKQAGIDWNKIGQFDFNQFRDLVLLLVNIFRKQVSSQEAAQAAQAPEPAQVPAGKGLDDPAAGLRKDTLDSLQEILECQVDAMQATVEAIGKFRRDS